MAYAKELREQMGRLSVDMRAIVDTAKAENNRGLTSAERERFHALETDYTNIEASIALAERSDSIADKLASADSNLASVIANTSTEQLRDEFRTDPQTQRQKSPRDRAFSKYLRNGMSTLTPEESREMVFLPNGAAGATIRNTMSTTTGSQGGYVVPAGFSNELEEAKKWFGGIPGTVGTFHTETGNPFPWPTLNDTANKGRIIGQNTQVTETDLAFGQVMFSAYIGSSDVVLIPLALVEDSYFDLDALTARLLGTRIGRLFNWKCTVGTGTSEPTGIVTAAVAAGNTYTCPTGETAAITYNDLINLEHSVDPAYRYNPGVKWMFSDAMLKLLKKLVDGQNRPLWQPGLSASFQNGAGVETSKPKILEHEYVINMDMAVPAANAYTILFGDMTNFKVRTVSGGTSVLRLHERYADYLQIGITAFQRFDSQLIDPGVHPLAVLQQSAT
jgi:HK97 family phage major capsid protein